MISIYRSLKSDMQPSSLESREKATALLLSFFLVATVLTCTGCKRRGGDGIVSRRPEVIREDPRKPGTRLTGIYHTLAKGENLWQLSRMYSVDIQAIKGVNSINGDPLLRVGLEIFVPGTPNVLLARKYQYLRGSGKAGGDSRAGTIVVNGTLPSTKSGIKKPTGVPGGRMPAAGTRFDWPMKGEVSLAFGKGSGVYANGVIIESVDTDQVGAASSGTVEYSGNVDKLGDVVIISHELNYFTLYARIKRPLVVLGEKVQAGEPVAVADREETGSQGPRNQVYFEIRNGDKPVDPVHLLN